MKPAGILLVFIILHIFIKKKDMQSIFRDLLTLELFFACTRLNFGYFMMLGGMEIEYNDILLGLLFCFSLVYILKNPQIPKSVFVWSLILLTIICSGIGMCYFNPVEVSVVDFNHSWDRYMRGYTDNMGPVHFSTQSILMLIRVLIFLVILWTAEKVMTVDDWCKQALNVGKGLKWFLVYGVFEYILKMLLHFPTNYILMNLFGTGRATSYGMDRLQGLSREPSYYALALFYSILVFGALMNIDSVNKKSYRREIIIASVLGLLSGSFSFIICILASIMILLLLSAQDNSKLRLLVVFTIVISTILGGVVVFSSEFIAFAETSGNTILIRIAESVNQLNNAIYGTYVLGEDYTSEAARFVGGIHSMKAGLLRPAIGLGLGTAYCTMGIPAIIANVGLGGLFAWMILLFKEYGKIFSNLLIILILLPAIVCSDLYTLYDTGYLLVLPILGIVSSTGVLYEQ